MRFGPVRCTPGVSAVKAVAFCRPSDLQLIVTNKSGQQIIFDTFMKTMIASSKMFATMVKDCSKELESVLSNQVQITTRVYDHQVFEAVLNVLHGGPPFPPHGRISFRDFSEIMFLADKYEMFEGLSSAIKRWWGAMEFPEYNTCVGSVKEDAFPALEAAPVLNLETCIMVLE